uniref:Uncharacterized protein n=1 Tax=Timema douglasi TaxID=61478 RepID=A0A7R8ZF13_TIMDO|nr:unnamed protein product [Timema douglasi]
MGGVDRQDQVQSQPSQRTSRPVVGRRSPRILSLSASSRSLSSCSDESCSVCSPKGKAPKKPPSPVARPRYRTPRSRPCPMGEKGASHLCVRTGETVSTKRFNRKKELVKNGNENMICGAAQAAERVVGVVCSSAKKRRKSQTVRHNKVARPDAPKGNDRDNSCLHGLAFAELVKYTNNDEDMAPVFKQVDTAQKQLRLPIEKHIHTTRLRTDCCCEDTDMEGKELIVAYRSGVFCFPAESYLARLAPCSQEEADAVQKGCRKANGWNQPLLKDPDLPEHSGWGWTKDTTGWQLLWATFAEASDSCHELIQCDCKKASTGHCTVLISRSFSVPRNHPTNRSPPSPRPEPRRPRERSSPPRDPRRPPTSPPPAARTKSKSKRKEGREKIKVEV